MKKLTEDQSKIDLVAKLVKEGNIDFSEAIKLLEIEVEKEYVTVPYYKDWYQPIPYQQPILTWSTTDVIISN